MYRLILVAALGFSMLGAGRAQGTRSALPEAPAPSQQAPSANGGQGTLQSGVAMVLMLEKKSVIFPDLATHQRRLSRWDKCRLAANTSVALPTIAAALMGSGIGQARNAPAGYGQEAGGYGKRFGADLARSASYQTFGPCLIASVAREDPRFFVREQLSFAQSLKYAAVRLVITRNDDGERVINYSGLLGTLAAETLANAYYPTGSRGIGNTFIRYSTDMAARYWGHLFRQYLPRIDRKLQLSAQ